MTILSLIVAAARKPLRIIPVLLPFLLLLTLFGAFVYWNGGVVLGTPSPIIIEETTADALYR